MKEIYINLNENYHRPMISLYNKLTLIDTGAVIPVISMNKTVLDILFSAKPVKDNVSIGGFGGGRSKGSIYSLRDFYIQSLHFKTLECFVPYEPSKDFSIILSAPLFYYTDYEFKPREHKLVIKVSEDKMSNNEFFIKDVKNKICVQINDTLL